MKLENQEKKKLRLCLFTCIVVRAVNLEIVDNLTANEFLMVLQRFIARQGKPGKINSDNAAQSNLSKSTFDVAWQTVIKDPSVQSNIFNQGIKWSFIIEISQWMG